ncbi:MAG: dihydropteroate synthase [Chloroflexota bacterium]
MASNIATRHPAPMTIGGREFVWGSRTYVMGIVNVTPDSFSGDGLAHDQNAAIHQALQMREDGADIIDVGGESTRPGFAEVDAEEEARRVLPVIERLAREFDLPVSVDTYKGSVAKSAIDAGATLVNDVHGFLSPDGRPSGREPVIARVAAEAGVPAVAMYYHRGRPFIDTIGNIMAGLQESFAVAREQGLPDERIIIDPGFNFGWKDEQALEMLRRLGELRVLGRPILVGTSRKSTIGNVLGLPVEERLEGTAATVAISIANGADIVRVHDVKEMARVARMTDAIVRPPRRAPVWAKEAGDAV